MSEALAEVIILGRPSITHRFSFRVTVLRCQDVENQFHKFQVPIIKQCTKTQTNGQATATDTISCGKSKDQHEYMMGL